jgi:hypothetical protein
MVLYGRPDCGPCVAFKAAFERVEIEYVYVDVTMSPEGFEHVPELASVLTEELLTRSFIDQPARIPGGGDSEFRSPVRNDRF